ncbi:glutaredoxin family protein [Paraglaciecola aestuariivivens]
MSLILYTGENCGLCEQAESMLITVNPQAAKALQKVKVRDDAHLYHLYGARIPVFFREDKQQELAWPFEPEQLKEFLN